jgi:hypothetical protein
VVWRGFEAWELGFDGAWREVNAATAATSARLMSEEEFHSRLPPPLPSAAFRSGWSSPLIWAPRWPCVGKAWPLLAVILLAFAATLISVLLVAALLAHRAEISLARLP